MVLWMNTYIIPENGIITYFNETSTTSIISMCAQTYIIANLHTLTYQP